MPSAPHCTLRITCSAALPSSSAFSALLHFALPYPALLWLALLSSNCFVVHSVYSCLILPSLSCLFYLARLLLCFVLLLDSFTLQNSALLMSAHVCSLVRTEGIQILKTVLGYSVTISYLLSIFFLLWCRLDNPEEQAMRRYVLK